MPSSADLEGPVAAVLRQECIGHLPEPRQVVHDHGVTLEHKVEALIQVLHRVVTAQCRLAARFLDFCSLGPLVKYSAPSVQTPTTGVT